MSTKDLQNALNAELLAWQQATGNGGLFIAFENGPTPDRGLDKWLDSEVRWYGGSQVSLGERPRGRHTGAISLDVYHRKASGHGAAADLVDSLIERFRMRRLGGAVLLMPQRKVPQQVLDWYRAGVLIPFYMDSM